MLPDISLTDLHVALAPGSGALPFTPTIAQFDAALSADAFHKVVEAGIAMVQSRLPMDVQLIETRLTDKGAEVTARAKRSVLKADIRAEIELSAPNQQAIRV